MSHVVFFAAYIPYEQGERYAHGENVAVQVWASFGAVLALVLMVWYIRKVRREKRNFGKRKR